MLAQLDGTTDSTTRTAVLAIPAGRRLVTVLAMTLALAASLLTGLVTAPAAHASAGSVIGSINAARQSAGRAPLSTSSALNSVAVSWARSMAKNGVLQHNPSLGSQVSSWSALAENVGVGASDSQVQRAFMGSSGHRANILSSKYTQVGVGIASGGGRVWVVEIFRLPAGASAPTTRKTTTTKKTTTRKTTTRKTTTTTTRKATVKKVSAKPQVTHKKVVKKATAPARSVKAVPVSTSARDFGAMLAHLRSLAVTNALGDAWSWLVHRVLGVGSTYGV